MFKKSASGIFHEIAPGSTKSAHMSEEDYLRNLRRIKRLDEEGWTGKLLSPESNSPWLQKLTPEYFVRFMKDLGADVNYAHSRYGTPLHMAVRAGDFEYIAALAKAGADVGAKDSVGKSPLHYAVALDGNEVFVCSRLVRYLGGDYMLNRRRTATQLLIGFGADVRAAEPENNSTPLHMACMKQPDYGLVSWLLLSGASAAALDSKGQTPFDLMRPEVRTYETNKSSDPATILLFRRLFIKYACAFLVGAKDYQAENPLGLLCCFDHLIRYIIAMSIPVPLRNNPEAEPVLD